MPRYDVFGYRIESDIELPELPASTRSGASAWRIQTVGGRLRGGAVAPLGTEAVFGSVQVHAFELDCGFRLVFDDTGTFDVSPRERVIAWHPGPGAANVAVRADLLGRVLALAAHADGLLALHASAVSIAGHAVAFIGPKHAGKSTLALALVKHGAKLLTDDTLVVRRAADEKLLAAPGVQRVRLWRDSARALGAESSGEAGAKPTVDCLTSDELESTSVPLSACYVLEDAGDRSTAEIHRDRLTPVHAAVACVRFSKLGALGGGSAAAAILDRAVTLTKIVPVFVAKVERDLTRLDDVAERIMDWHRSDRGVRAVSAQ